MKKLLITISAILLISITDAQIYQVDPALKAEIIERTNEQKSANTQDILTNLFRAGIDNLLGSSHSFTFSSTFYGLDSLLRSKSSSSQNDYRKERWLRKNSLDISIKGDSVNNITKIGGGFTFTLVDKKDISYKEIKELTILKRSANLFSYMRTQTNTVILDSISKSARDSFLQTLDLQKLSKVGADSLADLYITDHQGVWMRILQDSWSEADLKKDYSNLHPLIKNSLNGQLKSLKTDAVAVNAVLGQLSQYGLFQLTQKDLIDFIDAYDSEGRDLFHEQYENVAEKYARKPLWTFAPSMMYDRVVKQGTYSFETNFTVGFGRIGKKPWELELKGLLKIENDTLKKTTNYDNRPLSTSIGLNKVVIQNENNESKMELKIYYGFDHQFGTVNGGRKKDAHSFNSTFRINIYKSLWLPVTLKYDATNGNFLGLFSITANIGK